MWLEDPAGRQLEEARRTSRLHHAYLLLSRDEALLEQTVGYWQRRLLCPTPEADPAGVCAACRQVEAGGHPDGKTFRPTGQVFSIDLVRQVEAEVMRSPALAARRVFVLWGVDRLRREGANALLKTLEEPPTYLHFLLAAGREGGILPTIQSRAQMLVLQTLSPEGLVRLLTERYGVEPALAGEAASAGRLDRALRALGDPQAHRGLGEERGLLFEAVRNRDVETLLSFAERLAQEPLDERLGWLEQGLAGTEEEGALLQRIEEGRRQLPRNPNARLFWEGLLLGWALGGGG